MSEMNPIKQAMINDNAHTTNIIKDAFEHMGNGWNNLDESAFIYYFLPIFSGEREASKEDLDSWLTVTGSPFNGVNLTNGIGEVVNIVPPLKDRSGILSTGMGEDNDINLIINDFISTGNLSPQAAHVQLSNDLTDKYATNQPPDDKLLNEWKQLLSYYKPDIEVKGNNKASDSSKGVISNADNDELEYE